MKKSSIRISCLAACAVILSLAFTLVACSSSTPAKSENKADTAVSGAVDIQTAIKNAKAEDPYVADEVCLSCHGGTYEALEALTKDLGDSNPHGGTHGYGGVSCNLCHVNGQSVPTDETNWCLTCHPWPRADESYLENMDLK